MCTGDVYAGGQGAGLYLERLCQLAMFSLRPEG